jgi:hypothetical protein
VFPKKNVQRCAAEPSASRFGWCRCYRKFSNDLRMGR